MTVANISFNPQLVTNFTGSFVVSEEGAVQGQMFEQPNKIFNLESGMLASTETIPMWGGVAITVLLPAGTANGATSIGSNIARATAMALSGAGSISGFSVYKQASAMLQTPQSRVPVAGNYMAVNFFRLGSGARIAVQCDTSVASAFASNPDTTQVQWDLTNQKLIAFASGTALPVKLQRLFIGNSKIVSYNSGTGYANWTNNGTCVEIIL